MFFISRVVTRTKAGRRCSSLYSVSNVLGDDNMNRTMAKFKGMKPIRLQPFVPAKKAAVLIPLCVVDDKVSLIYTLRAPHLKSHSGQVSFPGGMQDMKDKSLEYTAVRETREELGIKENQIKIWGSGNLIVTRNEMCVLPVVGQVQRKVIEDGLDINPNEVKEVFVVSLEDLCDSKKLGYTQFRGSYSMPIFYGGPRKIWGLTALITYAFLKALLPSKAYSHKIRFVPPVSGAGAKFFNYQL